MPLEIINNNLIEVNTDAIVNITNSSEFKLDCRQVDNCAIGEAMITVDSDFGIKNIIHTVAPIAKSASRDDFLLLANCYRNSLELASLNDIQSIAFPLILADNNNYQINEVLKIATTEIKDFLLTHEMMVYLVMPDREISLVDKNIVTSIKKYIKERYNSSSANKLRSLAKSLVNSEENYYETSSNVKEELLVHYESAASFFDTTLPLHNYVANTEESFSQMLLRLIDERNTTDVETYKKANINRRLFSKIRTNVDYNPSKPTALAFAIALELNLDETKDLLAHAGYALSHSYKFDIIVEYFIEQKNYDIYEINEALFAFDQQLLGGN